MPFVLLLLFGTFTFALQSYFTFVKKVGTMITQSAISHKATLHKLVEFSRQPTCIISYLGHFQLVNPALTTLLGYSPAEFNACPYWEWVHEADKEVTLSEIQKLQLLSIASVGFANRMRKKNGSYVHVQWNIQPDPEQQLFFCYLEDMSKEVSQHQDRENYLQDMGLIIDGIDAGIWSWDITNGEEWWSDQFYQILEYKPGDIPVNYGTFLRLLHPDDKNKVIQAVGNHLKQEKPYKLDIRLMTGSGAYKWVETSGKASRNSVGEPSRMAGSIIDIDERKRLKIQNEHKDFLLEEAGQMAHVGGWELDFTTNIPIWSQEVYRIHEVAPDYQPDLATAVNFFAEASIPPLTEAINQAKEAGTPYDLELQFITAKGRHIWIRTIGKPIFNEQREVIGLRGVFMDINERKERELALNLSIETINEQNKRLQNFTYLVSHNLRSHVSNFSILKNFYQEIPEVEKKQELIGKIFQVSDNLGETIDFLDQLVQIQSNKAPQKEELAWETKYQKVMGILGMYAESRSAIIHVDFSTCPTVEHLPAYLESILFNLVSNAIKYGHPDRSPVIHLSSGIEEGRKFLRVEDNGVGIDLSRHREKVFGMYKTFHGNKDAKGLGLFLVKYQVEALGGMIELTSEVGKGSCFTVYFA